jgi:hypothetical protein
MSTIEIQFDKKFDNSRVVREFDLRCRTDYICITLLGAIFGYAVRMCRTKAFLSRKFGG